MCVWDGVVCLCVCVLFVLFLFVWVVVIVVVGGGDNIQDVIKHFYKQYSDCKTSYFARKR